MPRRRMMDGRNPYGSRGGYVVSSRRGRRDRAMSGDMGMDYGYDRRDYRGGDYEHGSMYGDRAYSEQDMERGRRDYESMGQSDMGYDDIDMRRRRNARGQYMSDRAYEDYGSFHEERGFRPVEAMGYFTGYYGGGQDMARGGRYDMRGRYDYGYDYAGDYGERLTEQEIEHFKKKLMQEVDEKDKQFFNKETFSQRVKSMGMPVGDKFSEEELCLTTLMMLTDYKNTLGTSNMDLYVRLAKDWLEDKDVAVKGGEKLAVYFDCIVEGEE